MDERNLLVMSIIERFCRLIVGVVFLLSGFGKAIDVSAFANLLAQYGFPSLMWIAPIIIIAEITLGLCLLLRIYPKQVTMFSIAMIVMFSVAFLYAQHAKNITDCGCFGAIKILEFSPAAVYIRNIIMMGMLLFSYIHLPSETKVIFSLRQYVFFLILLVASFMTGYTFHNKKKEKSQKHPLIEKPINETILTQYYNFSSDSSYVICVFSYRCSSCWNYMENLNRYRESPEIDHVIALSVGEDQNNKFVQFFNPKFDIISVNETEILKLTSVSPTVLYIQKDTIRYVIQGIVPSIHTFEKDYLSN